MNKPDLLITWIKHCDYPIFRLFLKRHRDFFGKVIIYWSEHFRHMYYDAFIQKALVDYGIECQFLPNIEYKYGVEDWRNIATNYMLQQSTSEWVCSVEQDWFVKDWEKLLTEVVVNSSKADLLGWWQPNGKYVHPAFWFMKREALEKTRKDFAAHDGFDHFGWITQDHLANGGKIISTQDMGFEDFKDAFHLGGVNQNYLQFGTPGYVFHRPEIFSVYNYWSIWATVPQSDEFLTLCRNVDASFQVTQPEIDPKTSEWKAFFQ
mgnify:FL=1